MADNHVVYKNGAKEIAHPERVLDHLHGEAVRGLDRQLVPRPLVAVAWGGARVRAGRAPVRRSGSRGRSPASRSWRCFSHRRSTRTSASRPGSWAPTTLAWGNDNRTCGFRVVGHGAARRVETRIPGGDVNPYLAFAAIIAAGLHGIEQELEPPPPLEGNAYESDARAVPRSRCEMRSPRSSRARWRVRRFGDQVVDHYLNYARPSSCSTTASSPTGSGRGTTSAVSRPRLRRNTSRWK